MLEQLSGRTHEVLTAIALRTATGQASRMSRSEVTFRAIAAGEVRAYWETGESRDKAGAYAIQGRAAVFVADLRGSFSGVMGLPLFETAELLADAGIPYWNAGGKTR
jgi:septum formation protein